MIRKHYLLLLWVFSATFLSAQTEKKCIVSFRALYADEPLQLNRSYPAIKTKDSTQIETLKFYISGIEVLANNKTVWKEKNSFHLIDVSDTMSLRFSLDMPSNLQFNKLKFNLGIDSVTNVSGALDGALDPTKGMYWAWQSGYINLKLEGKSNLCKTRNNQFQFHLGGYQFPFNAIQTVQLDVDQTKKIEIFVTLEKLLSEIDLSHQNEIMSPGKEAVLLSDKAEKMFSTKKE